MPRAIAQVTHTHARSFSSSQMGFSGFARAGQVPSSPFSFSRGRSCPPGPKAACTQPSGSLLQVVGVTGGLGTGLQGTKHFSSK